MCERDLVFLLHTRDMTGVHADSMTDFIVDLVEGLSEETRVGLAFFGQSPRFHWHLNTWDNKDKIQSTLSNIDSGVCYKREHLNITAALEYLNTAMFMTANGDRRDINNVAVLMVDEIPEDLAEAANYAETVKQAGIILVTVGVGCGVAEALAGLASHPYLSLGMNQHSELVGIRGHLLDIICTD